MHIESVIYTDCYLNLAFHFITVQYGFSLAVVLSECYEGQHI